MKDRQRWSSAPYFIVDDVVSTANYFRDKVSFHYERFWNDPPSFCMVKRNGACDQPYGCRDFDIEDCNGYRLCFGQDLEG